ncbi:MAG: Gfo/Idh/MocA family oxidoreductase [Elusimicrobia bacterium]|nr:Gfo/Idh/MocA family oxidoreductase [Elusimicrobiota bacterium]
MTQAPAPLRGALVGFGRVAEDAHLPAFRASPGFVVAAVVEADPRRRKAAAAALPGARLYASLAELSADGLGLDFADIATPPWLHAPLAKEALEAGLHVLCEKPLAFCEADLDALAAAAGARGRALVCVHNWKKAPLAAKLKELLDAGAVGDLRYAEWQVLRTKPAGDVGGGWRTDPARSGGGIVMDHGWHAFYLLSWLLGRRPSAASAVLAPAARREEEATVLASFGGLPAVVHLSWRADRRGHRGEFRGARGCVEVHDDALVVRLSDGSESRFVFAEPLSKGSAHPEWFRELLGDFANAVRDPAARARALDEARAAMRLVELCYASETRGRRRARGPKKP